MATTAVLVNRTWSVGILVSVKDQERNGVGRDSGWGVDEDLYVPPERDETGPSMVSLAYGTNRWGRTLGCLFIPAALVLITFEMDVLHIPAAAVWISLVGLVVAFVLIGFSIDRRRT